MKDIKNVLRSNKKKIVIDGYKIALAKQDIALGLVDSITKVLERESPSQYTKEKIADLLFVNIQNLDNKIIEDYLKAPDKEKYKIRLKIEKSVIKNIANRRHE